MARVEAVQRPDGSLGFVGDVVLGSGDSLILHWKAPEPNCELAYAEIVRREDDAPPLDTAEIERTLRGMEDELVRESMRLQKVVGPEQSVSLGLLDVAISQVKVARETLVVRRQLA
jgi:hypothetical protein